VTAAFQYAAPLDALIMQLKYGARLPVGRVLGELMAEALMDCGNRARPDAILPVPLHPVRLRDRGFNQSAEIARPIAAALEIPIDIHTCVRVRNTAEQALLKAHERVRNLRDAFRVVRDPPYRHVAIVDDVLTTGSTVEALAWPLRMAGVETIEVWACARALTATN
jgi:ComF family protein